MAEENENLEEAANRTYFAESEELNGLISQLINATDDDVAREAHYDKAKAILEKYQEMPQLLNPYLEDIITPLIQNVYSVVQEGATSDGTPKRDINLLMRLIYIVSKVRGYKSVVSYFPHEVVLLEPVFQFFCQQSETSWETWETRYVLLLWLSNIVLIPFALSTVDSNHHTETLTNSIINACKVSLSETGKVREAAAYLLSKLLTRPDTHEGLKSFLAWAAPIIESPPGADPKAPFLQAGVLLTLAHVLKYGQRQELMPHLDSMAEIILQQTSEDQSDNTLRSKLLLKVGQRMASAYLPKRAVKWQYQKGNRSLLTNLASSHGIGAGGSTAASSTSMDVDVDDEIHIPEHVEEIVGLLLDGLKHKDTVVRWSAAKGIGRTTQRLPLDSAEDVVMALLSNCFDLHEDDCGWHGGCLCLAELSRRGLLLPDKFEQVVPIVLKGLKYNLLKANRSVGSHVRDAACYVCWAFARAYQPQDLQQYVGKVSQQLIITALFDREVNVRRAAAAAFQECVGRLGTFPHGIDIIQIADYSSLASRNHAYLVLAPRIAEWNEYCQPMIEHLMDDKIRHWDSEVREAAAKALGALAPKLPEYALEYIIPSLVKDCLSPASDDRHGALLSLAECILSLSQAGLPLVKDPEDLEHIRQLMPKIESERLYRGKGGERIRVAVCKLVQSLAEAKIPLPEISVYTSQGKFGQKTQKKTKTLVKFQESLEENLTNTSADVQAAANAAFKAFGAQYYASWVEGIHGPLIKRLLEGLQTTKTPNVRRGCALAVGALPPVIINHRFEDGSTVFGSCVLALKAAMKIESSADTQDAESRRNATQGLVELCLSAGISNDTDYGATADAYVEANPGTIAGTCVDSKNVGVIFEAFLDGMGDYAIDNRGDVGSFTRLAAIEGSYTFIHTLSKGSKLLTPELWCSFLAAILKQLMEKIDRVRGVAGSVLHKAVMDTEIPEDFPHKTRIATAIRDRIVEESTSLGHTAEDHDQIVLDWSSPSISFPLIVPLLLTEQTFLMPMLEGLIISVGGLSMHVVRAASTAMMGLLATLPSNLGESTEEGPSTPVSLVTISNAIVAIFEKHASDDRVIMPLLSTLDKLCTKRLLHPSVGGTVLQLIKSELNANPRDVNRKLSVVDVLCGLLSLPYATEGEESKTLTATVQLLLSLLGTKFPKVRAKTATQFYTALTIGEEFDKLEEETVDDILEILLTTKWDGLDMAEINGSRDKLYPLFGLQKPIPKPKVAKPAPQKPKKQEDEGYQALVNDAGY